MPAFVNVIVKINDVTVVLKTTVFDKFTPITHADEPIHRGPN